MGQSPDWVWPWGGLHLHGPRAGQVAAPHCVLWGMVPDPHFLFELIVGALQKIYRSVCVPDVPYWNFQPLWPPLAYSICHPGRTSYSGGCGWLSLIRWHTSPQINVWWPSHGSLQLVYWSLNGQSTGLWTSQNGSEKTFRARQVRQGRLAKCYGKWELLWPLPF